MSYYIFSHKFFSSDIVVDKYLSLLYLSLPKIKKRVVCIFSIIFLLLTILTTKSYAQRTVITHNISTDGSLVIQNTSINDYVVTGTTFSNRIIVSSGYQGTITLRNVGITSSGTASFTALCGNGTNTVITGSCMAIMGKNNQSNLDPVTRVNIVLEGQNSLLYTSNNSYCAIQVDQGAQIQISAIDPNDNASGKLIAKSTTYEPGTQVSQGGAAIGAISRMANPYNIDQGTAPLNNGSSGPTAGGNIIISSGTITAWGGHGAGIGGSFLSYYNGVIIVYGGIVEARGGFDSAGIGSGCPEGTGVLQQYADNSAVIALPPAEITAYGAGEKASGGVGTTQFPELGLTGTKNITYMNDPNKPLITVRTEGERTEDYEKNANIYLDLTETPGLVDIFQTLGIDYDLAKVKIGKTDASSGVLQFHGRFEQNTTFFTDASSSQSAHLGRPYLPVTKTVLAEETIVLPLLATEISFTDYPSTPLELGYTVQQAWDHAHIIKMEYIDPDKMEDVTFRLQSETDFKSINFLDKDKNPLPSAPTTLVSGDIYYIVLPIETGKPLGVYSDVLLINGKWKDIPLPGYIRRIGMQRVVTDDTGKNEYIKVTASPSKFISLYPTMETVELTLNINHTGTNILYDPLDVKAKYLITTEADYNVALAANPLATWSDLSIPVANAQNEITTVSFSGKPLGTYYIHWYVESGVVYAHSQNVTSPPLQYGGFGPYIITTQVKAGNISGNPYVCKGQAPSEIKGEPSTGGSGDFTYKWQKSINGVAWEDIANSNTLNYFPEILATDPTYFRRETTDNQHGETFYSNIFSIKIVADGLTLYWNRNATNHNWNDPANWTDASGTPLGIVPVSCSNVYIPGGLNIYPSLDPIDTPIETYGMPICSHITFEYGAELAYQHKLTYEKAYVQYNWGYYGSLSGLSYGGKPTSNGSILAPMMARDTWHALAAPLKSMATGDFAFAGYPLTWQAGFSLSDPQTGVKGGEIEVGDFSKKFSANDTPLTETNNAIAVKVALYQSPVGYNNHCNLEGLKGIIEIPYFENEAKATYYPGHIYDKFAKESKFFYFNPQTLQLLHSPIGRMKRDKEAYRFVYEENGIAPSIPSIDVSGEPTAVAGYKQKVKKQSSTSLKVMIGNPFLASINSYRFYSANKVKLNLSAGFQIFDATTQVWKHYDYARTNNIPPLQAFIVTLQNDEEELLFPLDGGLSLTGSAFRGLSTSSAVPKSLYLKSVGNNNLEGDHSVLEAAIAENTSENVTKMISSQGHAVPETFFISSDGKNYNLIQAYEESIREIGIGVRCSDMKNTLSLTFENVDEFSAANKLYPVLFDKHLGFRQNLTSNNTYDFIQRKVESANQYIDADRFALQLLSSEDLLELEKANNISIVYVNKQIEVRANQNIKEVQIYDMLGRRVYIDTNINSNYYTKVVSLTQGAYAVKVYTKDGETKTGKIIAL